MFITVIPFPREAPLPGIIASNDISVDFLFPYASPDKFYVGQSATVFITGFAVPIRERFLRA